MAKYNEIFRLKEMLEGEEIPFEFSELHGGYHIVYPTDGDKCVCSVIEHDFSYGMEKDLLEIKGLMTKLEEETLEDDVLGYLTAENVFQRIKKHWGTIKRRNAIVYMGLFDVIAEYFLSWENDIRNTIQDYESGRYCTERQFCVDCYTILGGMCNFFEKLDKKLKRS